MNKLDANWVLGENAQANRLQKTIYYRGVQRRQAGLLDGHGMCVWGWCLGGVGDGMNGVRMADREHSDRCLNDKL